MTLTNYIVLQIIVCKLVLHLDKGYFKVYTYFQVSVKYFQKYAA